MRTNARPIRRALHILGSPRDFYRLSGIALPWISVLAIVLLCVGVYLALFVAPADYQQGEHYRIMFLHVPAAWMSLSTYLIMASASVSVLIWNVKTADVVAACSAPLGAAFTFLTLATGSLWGKPVWFTWWVWDARLTSELVLLFLYLGYMGLRAAFSEPALAARPAALLNLVGVVNIPIIHYSVVWWNTLHQPPSLAPLAKPAIHDSMLWPLLVLAVAFQIYYLATMLARARAEIIRREGRAQWVRDRAADRPPGGSAPEGEEGA